jgi:hypothetical protein
MNTRFTRGRHPGRLAGTALLAVAALSWSAPADAQSAVDDSVLNRPRPGYDALGIDLFAGPSDPGSPFILYPTLDVAGGWDDNVFRDDSGEKDDFLLKVSPALNLASDWDRHGLSLSARADIARWEEFQQNNSTNFEVATRGFLDVGTDSQLYAGATFGRSSDFRDDVNNAGTNNLVRYWTNTQEVGFQTYAGDLQSNTRGTRQRYNYVDNGANQDDRDYTQYDVSQRFGYEFQPGVVLFVQGGYNWRLYDDAVDDFGYQRGSQGWEVEGGLSYDVTGVLSAEVRAGYLSQRYDDPSFGKNAGFAVDGDITWNPSDLTTIRGYAGTSIQETTLDGYSGGYTTYGGLGFDYDLADNLIFTSDLVYTSVHYDPAPGFTARKDDIIQGQAGLIWLINEYFSTRLDYTHTNRDSNIPGEDFSDNTIMLTLHSQL